MFGCCVAGRLLQTNLQQIDETHALFELNDASTINHVCVFLLGTVAFPDGYGATVHFYWPGKGFQLLGMLSNDKPSAIFRLRGTFTSTPTSSQNLLSQSQTHTAFSSNISSQQQQNPSNPSPSITAILGFSILPLTEIEPQLRTIPTPPINTNNNNTTASGSTSNALTNPSTSNPTILAERIVKHLFNYISSFIGGAPTPEIMVPMGIIAKWYEMFLGKVKAGGVGFLERDD